MNFKLIGLALAVLALSDNSASAGWRRYKVDSGKVVDYIGCGRQEHAVRQMMKHPELYGKPPASMVATLSRKHPELWNKPQASMVSLKSQ